MKLNLGCGKYIKKRYINIDINLFEGVDLICDAGRLPFKKESIEEILASDIIEHFPWREVKEVLGEWWRVLKPKGKLWIRTPNLEGLLELYQRRPPGWQREDGKKIGIDPIVDRIFGRQDYKGNYHYAIFDPKSMKELLLEYGFTHIDVNPDGEDISNICATAVKGFSFSGDFRCSVIIQLREDKPIVAELMESIKNNMMMGLPSEIILVGINPSGARKGLLPIFNGNIKTVTVRDCYTSAAALNQGAKEAAGKYLIFLDGDAIPKDGWFFEMVKLAEKDEKIGCIGSKTLNCGGKIQDAGIAFLETKEPWPIYRNAASDFPGCNKPRQYQAIMSASLLVRREDFLKVGLFDEAYREGLEAIDLCLKIRQLGKKVVYCPQSVLSYHGSIPRGNPMDMQKDLQILKERWSEKIEPDLYRFYLEDGLILENTNCKRYKSCPIVKRFREKIHAQNIVNGLPIRVCSDDYRFYDPQSFTSTEKYKFCPKLGELRKQIAESRICWESPVFGPSGYAFAARGYVLGLSDVGATVTVQPMWGDCKLREKEGCRGERWMPKKHTFQATLNGRSGVWEFESPVSSECVDRLLKLTAVQTGGVYVCHHPPTDVDGANLFRKFREQNPGMRAYVGYATFETDRIPEQWVDPCNEMDEVWVPSHFNLETFANSGVERDKIQLIPHGFDPKDYDPTRTEPLNLGKEGKFKFLSIFEWTYRKGWDVLIKAYLEEFSDEEDVCLIIRTYQGGGVTGKKKMPIPQQLTSYIASLGYDPEEIPDIELVDQMIPAEMMPSFYLAADAFIIPTRGEGWGIPFTEAMLMERPVIGTRWGGQLEFMNDDNSYLIDIEGIVPVAEEQIRDNPYYRGHNWAEPSVTHTRKLMRYVFENRNEAEEKGKRARLDICQNWTTYHAAIKIAERVRILDRTVSKPLINEVNISPVSKEQTIARPRRILFQARENVFELPGGDTEVLLALKSNLEELGLKVDFSCNCCLPLGDYDLIHIFNFDVRYAVNAVLQNKPYVVTPMYEDYRRYYQKSIRIAALFKDYLLTNGRQKFLHGLKGLSDSDFPSILPDYEFIASNACAIFASGESEKIRIKKDFPNSKKVEVVKLGINSPVDSEEISTDLFISEYGVKDFVLCVGRLETRKNQLMLLYALQNLSVPIVFINSSTTQPEYEELCKEFRRRGETIFTGRVSQEMLVSAYKAAKVHALPSWYELPGLTSLEAARFGCNIVATRWGTIEDYAEEDVFYCEPDDPESIKRAVMEAMRAPKNERLKARLKEFTWERTARKVADLYQQALREWKSIQTRKQNEKAIKQALMEKRYHDSLERSGFFRDQGVLDKAVQLSKEALEIKSNSQAAFFNIGLSYLKQGNFKEAEMNLKRAVELTTYYQEKTPHLYLALSYMHQEKYTEAAAILHELIDVDVSSDKREKTLIYEYLRRCYNGMRQTIEIT